MENIKNEIETPQLDTFDKKYAIYEYWIINLTCWISSGSLEFYFLYVVILRMFLNLSIVALFFYCFGVIITTLAIGLGFGYLLLEISYRWVYGFFLMKNQLAYQEYLKYYEKDQYEEVS